MENKDLVPAHDADMEWEEHLVAAFKGLRREFKQVLQDFPLAEFRQHTRAARREMLLAARTLLDAALARLEDKPAEPTEPKAGRVTIE